MNDVGLDDGAGVEWAGGATQSPELRRFRALQLLLLDLG